MNTWLHFNLYGKLMRGTERPSVLNNAAAGQSWFVSGQLRMPTMVVYEADELELELPIECEQEFEEGEARLHFADLPQEVRDALSEEDAELDDSEALEVADCDDNDDDQPRRRSRRSKLHKQHLWYVSDTKNLLPLPHTGMFVSLEVQRVRQLSEDARDALKYDYEVVRVRTVRAAPSLVTPILMAGVLNEHQEKPSRAALTKQRKTVARLRKNLQSIDAVQAATLYRLLHECPDSHMREVLLRDATNWFAAKKIDLLGYRCAPLAHYQSLGGARTLTSSSLAASACDELPALRIFLRRLPLPQQLFFGMYDVLPLHRADAPVLSQFAHVCAGKKIDGSASERRAKAAQQLVRLYIEELAEEDEELLLHVIEHAQRLVRGLMRLERRSTSETIHSLRSILVYAYGPNVPDALYVDVAMRLLLAVGAWHRPPPIMLESARIGLLRRTGEQSQRQLSELMTLVSSDRAFRRSRRVAHLLGAIDPSLVEVRAGSETPQWLLDDAFVVCAGHKASGASANFLSSSFEALFEEGAAVRDSHGADSLVLHTGIAHVVLLDAHLCDELALERFCAWVQQRPADCAVYLAGDTMLASTFRNLWLARRFPCVRAHAGDNQSHADVAEHFDEFARMFGGEAPQQAEEVDSKTGAEYLRATAFSARFRHGAAQTLAQCVAHKARCVNEWRAEFLKGPASRRIVIVAETKRERERALLECAKAFAFLEQPKVAQKIEELVARNSNALAETLFLALPFVRYRRRGLLVHEAYVRITVDNFAQEIAKNSCLPLRADEFASLDDPHLFIRVDQPGVNHCVCCNTWASDVMSVARHRAALTSEPFAFARAAAPVLAEEATIIYSTEYRYDDVYAAMAGAAPYARAYYHYWLDETASEDESNEHYLARSLQRFSARPRSSLEYLVFDDDE